jgi:hypothetical protein
MIAIDMYKVKKSGKERLLMSACDGVIDIKFRTLDEVIEATKTMLAINAALQEFVSMNDKGNFH